ncbi:MAG: Uncharacterized protein AWT59_3194 [Candidatus Gallionella acididurans]|uniref:Uncharacterized protein n=1 Tax=Candidatus Gallionella acididurans TaxID=1796491 RepID=A0A139BNZ4_9PROT|nr:MAG: Uncharacterized protein AWT59_3194 [Candidatus Gallionella acididurans]
MKPSTATLFRSWTLLPLAAALALSFSACSSGSGGGGGGVASTLSGAVIDGPIVGATIVITTGAPLNQPGATQVGTATSGTGGAYTVSVTLPSSAVPVFANATATTPSGTSVVLASYLGSANTVSASGTLTATNIPNLVVSQVTTAALAIYQKLSGGSYANLTPAVYAALLSQHHDDILPIAAAIQAVTDDLCTKPANFRDTKSMAEDIANISTLAGGTTTSTVTTSTSKTFATGCDAELQNLTLSIASNETWAPELDLGDINQQGITVLAAGNYTLQGLITQTGLFADAPASAPSATVPAPSPFNDTTVTVSASGQIISTDNNVTGSVVGNSVQLNVTDAIKNSYTFAGKLGVLPATFLSTGAGSGYAVRAGGQANGTTPTLSRLDAVLVPASAQPVWTGVANNSGQSEDGLACQTGTTGAFGVRLMGNGSTVGGIVLGACVAPQPTGLALSQSTSMGAEDEYNNAPLSFGPFTLTQGTGANPMPFVISGAATLPGLNNTAGVSGTAYYVMGANEIVFGSSSPSSNNLFTMNENPLDKLQETQSNQDH